MVLIYEVPFLVEEWCSIHDYTICEVGSAQCNFHICIRPSIAKFPGWTAKPPSPQTGRNEVFDSLCLLEVAKGHLCPLAGSCFWAAGHNLDG